VSGRIIEIDRTGVHIAAHRDQHLAQVAGHAVDADFTVRQAGGEGLPQGCGGVGLGIDAHTIAHVEGGQQFVGFGMEAGAGKVDLIIRVFFHQGPLAGFDIQEHELGQVHFATVGGDVDMLAVRMESGRIHVLFVSCGGDLMQALHIHPQQFAAAAGCGPVSQAQFAFVVEHPEANALRVLTHEGALAGGNVDSINIVVTGIAVVQADHHHIGIVLGYGENLGTYTINGCQVASRRHTGVRFDLAVRIHSPDMEVLVAALVLDVQQILAVAAPEVAGHGAFIGGDGLGVVEGRIGGLDPDISGALVGLHEAHPLAIG